MAEPGRPRLLESLRGFLDTALQIAQIRLELLAVEVQEEKLRLGSLLFNIVLAGVLVGFGAVFLAVFLTVLFWDEHRLLAPSTEGASGRRIGVAQVDGVDRRHQLRIQRHIPR